MLHFHRAPSQSTNDDEECSNVWEAIDVKIAAQERQQDAVEGDSTDEDWGIRGENEDLGYDEPLIRDVYIPSWWKEYEGSIL